MNSAKLGLLAAISIFIPLTFSIPLEQIEPRITGGKEALPHSLPYQVGFNIQLSDGRKSWCGGSLISDEYVVTAAHCIDRAEIATLHLGTHNTKIKENLEQHIEVTKSNFILHEKWSKSLMKNDIGLVKLPEKVRLNEHIQPIRLIRQNQLLVGETVITSGWGRLSSNMTIPRPDTLRFVEMAVADDKNCINLFHYFKSEFDICVEGSNGKSACPGDSGGPLVYTESDGIKTLVGITSYGYSKGCDLGYPSVYTKLTTFLQWISTKTGIILRD